MRLKIRGTAVDCTTEHRISGNVYAVTASSLSNLLDINLTYIDFTNFFNQLGANWLSQAL